MQDLFALGGVRDAQALVVGCDDDVAGLGEGEGRHEVVPEVADVGGGAGGEDTGGGVRPDDDRVGIVGGGEVARGVGEEDGCGGGDEGAVEGGGLVEDAREGGEGGKGVERGVGGFMFEERASGGGGCVARGLVEGVSGDGAGGPIRALEVEGDGEVGDEGCREVCGGDLGWGELVGGVEGVGLGVEGGRGGLGSCWGEEEGGPDEGYSGAGKVHGENSSGS